jgi:hypothetical protein
MEFGASRHTKDISYLNYHGSVILGDTGSDTRRLTQTLPSLPERSHNLQTSWQLRMNFKNLRDQVELYATSLLTILPLKPNIEVW